MVGGKERMKKSNEIKLKKRKSEEKNEKIRSESNWNNERKENRKGKLNKEGKIVGKGRRGDEEQTEDIKEDIHRKSRYISEM